MFHDLPSRQLIFGNLGVCRRELWVSMMDGDKNDSEGNMLNWEWCAVFRPLEEDNGCHADAHEVIWSEHVQ